MRRDYQPGDPDDPRDREDRDRMQQLQRHRQTRAAKTVVVLGLLLILVLFIVWNAHKVDVSFVFGTAEVGLIWVMLVCAVLGGIIGFIVGRPGRGFRFGRRDDEEEDR